MAVRIQMMLLQVTGTTFTSQDALASSTARLTVEIAPESVNIQYEHITVTTGEVRRMTDNYY